MSSEDADALIGKLSNAKNQQDHPALKLFSPFHPLTKEFDFNFLGATNGILKVRGTAPQTMTYKTGSNVVHSAFTTMFFDTVMGSVVLGELDKPQPIATINLTTNNNLPVIVGDVLICSARFDKDVEEVAYVTGELRKESDDSLIATCIGTFMVGTRSKPMKKGG